MLHSMAIRLIHVDQLEMLYLCYGVKCQSGVIWGHRGQNIVFCTKQCSKCFSSYGLRSMVT